MVDQIGNQVAEKYKLSCGTCDGEYGCSHVITALQDYLREKMRVILNDLLQEFFGGNR